MTCRTPLDVGAVVGGLLYSGLLSSWGNHQRQATVLVAHAADLHGSPMPSLVWLGWGGNWCVQHHWRHVSPFDGSA
jgi:hypothetical protein